MATIEESSYEQRSSEALDRPGQLQAEIQQCQIEMVYCSLLERRRLQRQIMRGRGRNLSYGAFATLARNRRAQPRDLGGRIVRRALRCR